jgi:hypothetical protein
MYETRIARILWIYVRDTDRADLLLLPAGDCPLMTDVDLAEGEAG